MWAAQDLFCFKLNVADKQGRVPETTLQCVQYLRRHLPRSRVSIEVEKPGRDGLRDLASEADVVFYSRSWAEVSLCSSLTQTRQWNGSGRSSETVCIVAVRKKL